MHGTCDTERPKSFNLREAMTISPTSQSAAAELRALIFDVDGTLADTERNAHRPAFNAAFRDAGLNWEWSVELYGELLAVTGGKERIRRYVDDHRPQFSPPSSLDDYIADLHKAKTAHYTAMVAQGAVPLRPGVRRLLAEAHDAGLRLAIATTTTLDNVTALLERCLDPQAASWFDVIAAGDVVPKKKPAPDIYLYALEQLGLSAVDCLAVEDSANGLRSARAAGLQTVVTVSDYTSADDFTGALVVLDHLGEPGEPPRTLAGPWTIEGPVDIATLRRLHAGAG